MLRSFYIATTGLESSREWLDITANNVANANTIGFKKSKPIFQDIVLQSLLQYQSSTGSIVTSTYGGGSIVGYTFKDFSMGPFKTTGVSTDIAIEGDGFLMLEDNSGARFYSRDGQLKFSSGVKDGKEVMYLMHSSGMKVLGLSYSTNKLEPIAIETLLEPKATTQIYTQEGSNLDPRGEVPTQDFSPENAQSFNIAYTVSVYTTDGQSKDVSIYMKKLNPKIYDNNGNHYYTFVATDDNGNKYFVYYDNGQYYKTQLTQSSTLTSLPSTAVLVADNVKYNGDNYNIYWYLDNNNQPHLIAEDQNGTIYDVLQDTQNQLTDYKTVEAASVEDYWETFVVLRDGNEVYNILDSTNNKIVNNPAGGVDKEGDYTYAILKFKDGKIQSEYTRVNLSTAELPSTLREKLKLEEVSLDGLTQYPVDFSLGYLQDGYNAGRFVSLSIGENGVITALYSNGVSKDIYRLQLAYFKNKQALSPKGANVYATFSTVQPIIENAGVASKIRSGTLELSNVDIAQEMINMITAEKAYQANAKVIQTGQTIVDTTINLKR
jgi:flagellar hook protein FlgE